MGDTVRSSTGESGVEGSSHRCRCNRAIGERARNQIGASRRQRIHASSGGSSNNSRISGGRSGDGGSCVDGGDSDDISFGGESNGCRDSISRGGSGGNGGPEGIGGGGYNGGSGNPSGGGGSSTLGGIVTSGNRGAYSLWMTATGSGRRCEIGSAYRGSKWVLLVSTQIRPRHWAHVTSNESWPQLADPNFGAIMESQHFSDGPFRQPFISGFLSSNWILVYLEVVLILLAYIQLTVLCFRLSHWSDPVPVSTAQWLAPWTWLSPLTLDSSPDRAGPLRTNCRVPDFDQLTTRGDGGQSFSRLGVQHFTCGYGRIATTIAARLSAFPPAVLFYQWPMLRHCGGLQSALAFQQRCTVVHAHQGSPARQGATHE
jgi:hypothetical protein